jgi:hypothetical protein
MDAVGAAKSNVNERIKTGNFMIRDDSLMPKNILSCSRFKLLLYNSPSPPIHSTDGIIK